jgi:tRNA G46 methylase TrmB
VVCGENIIVATDHEDYMLNILKNLREIPNLGYCDDINLLSNRPSCLLKTKYEEKALLKNKKCYYFRIYTPLQGKN